MIASTTWPDVALAFIPLIGSMFTAYLAFLIKRDIRTPSGKPIGKQVEDTLHTATANFHYSDAISRHVGARLTPMRGDEAAKVEAMSEPDTEPPELPVVPPPGTP